MLLNTADDPLVERIVTPQIALTIAEDLAFERDRHVLVVMADLTSYCEALREVAAGRGEIPSRRGYPGHLYSDLASLLERAGRIKGRAGSVTQLPVLTMPAGDINHPVPDTVGYITEGQLVLSPELHAAGIYPPFDALGSLSRLMRLGAGPGRTREDHLELAAQLYALAAEARRARELAEVLGEDALSSGGAPAAGVRRGDERRAARPGSRREPLARRNARARLARRLAAAALRADDALHRRAGRVLPRGAAMRVRHPPGRAGRPWLAHRLEVARRGAELLEEKQRALLRERAGSSRCARGHAASGSCAPARRSGGWREQRCSVASANSTSSGPRHSRT